MNVSTMPTFARGQFRKAARSGQDPQACVEVARGHGWVEIRDTKQEWDSDDDHRLVFTAEHFDAFLAAAVKGTVEGLCIEITRHADGTNVLRSTVPQQHDHVLRFTDDEISAFLHGVRHGEFSECRFIEAAVA
jgi:hypothetical protein